MGMRFEELDRDTRHFMLAEFDLEQEDVNPFVGADLSAVGRRAFPELVRAAIEDGDDDTLASAFHRPGLWETHQPYRKKDGSMDQRRINVGQRARLLGLSEFNTWYVRGLSVRLIEGGIDFCEIYRAAEPLWEPSSGCLAQEGALVPVRDVYNGHRARYWPAPGDPDAFSVPIGVNCHHTIRRR